MQKPKHCSSVAMLQNIPDEILVKIFLKLPVRTLVRFKSVSKAWNSLICDPFFVKEHLEKGEVVRHNSKTFLVVNIRYYPHESPIYAVCSWKTPSQKIMDLDFPFGNIEPRGLTMVGNCHGLVCLKSLPRGKMKNVYIWNPSINKCIIVPESPFSRMRGNTSTYIGFGFSSTNKVAMDDYKVVKISKRGEQEKWSEVEVYNLRNNSWKSIGDAFPSRSYYLSPEPVVMNGNAHWSTETEPHLQEGTVSLPIISFDMANEVFKEITLPGSIPRNRRKGLGMLGSSLSIFYTHPYPERTLEAWVMKEYGLVESWDRLYIISTDGALYTTAGLGIMESGELICDKLHSLISYDPRTRDFENFNGIELSMCKPQIAFYVESLVWVATDEHDSSNQSTGDNYSCKQSIALENVSSKQINITRYWSRLLKLLGRKTI